jgi:hypothetical protein
MWEPCVPGAGNPGFQDLRALVQFLELGTRGSKIVKHCFEYWGTSNSSNAEPVVLRLGHIGSNVWEPAIPLLQQHIRVYAGVMMVSAASVWFLQSDLKNKPRLSGALLANILRKKSGTYK